MAGARFRQGGVAFTVKRFPRGAEDHGFKDQRRTVRTVVVVNPKEHGGHERTVDYFRRHYFRGQGQFFYSGRRPWLPVFKNVKQRTAVRALNPSEMAVRRNVRDVRGSAVILLHGLSKIPARAIAPRCCFIGGTVNHAAGENGLGFVPRGCPIHAENTTGGFTNLAFSGTAREYKRI